MKAIEPGCLAIITNAIIQENIGKQVVVVAPHGRDIHPLIGPNVQFWKIEAGEALPCTNSRRDNFTSSFGYHPEEWLLRIDGRSTEEQEVRETIEA